MIAADVRSKLDRLTRNEKDFLLYWIADRAPELAAVGLDRVEQIST